MADTQERRDAGQRRAGNVRRKRAKSKVVVQVIVFERIGRSGHAQIEVR